MISTTEENAVDILEQSRLDCIDKFSLHLISEIRLAKSCGGFYDREYYSNYLSTKYAHQNAMNEFYNLLHELSK